jgi:CBS domain containing-hemolysin-like protein
MLALLLAVLAVLIASALASGTEAALFAVGYPEVLAAVEQRRRGSLTLRRLQQDLTRPIMAIVIWNNVANIGGSILVGSLAARELGSAWLGAFSALLTFMVILFSEIIPKTLGERNALTVALWVARPVTWLSRALLPIIALVELLVRPIAPASVRRTSEAEIRALTRQGGREGVIEQDESELIQRVFRMNDMTAGMIMTPMSQVDALEASRPIGDLSAWTRDVTHTRIPLHQADDFNGVVGVVNVRWILQALADGRHDQPVAALAAEPWFVPSSMRTDDLLREFQTRKQHLAVVVDGLGTLQGVVTLEDVLEELVGEIEDETDLETRALVRLSDDALLAQPEANMKEVARAMGVTCTREGRIAELLVSDLGRIPRARERLSWNGLTVEILEARRQRITLMRVERAPPEGDGGSA